eukprot:gnl/TRDRNA2_/TRDRNA2_187740_c0_seq1.p1 gnl/TRDRNA2_/TRDRNA2_187740_c0~~gnl/TRDRNA2_/TRDRNA2_187740_c0_seq1.p1  ORF type:complete len:208 (+),score=39.60 gnl/TRDRNA2_/TRDRNA2_187740_c0_seq1:92-715(+)
MGNVPSGRCSATSCEAAGRDCAAVVANPTLVELPHQNMVNQQLLKAAKEGDLVLLKIAVAEGAFLETRRPLAIIRIDHTAAINQKPNAPREGMTPLMHAAKGGYLKCVRHLLEAKAKVNAEDEDKMTPLHFAAQSAEIALCRLLIGYGADASCVDADGKNAYDHLPEEAFRKKQDCIDWQELLGVPTHPCLSGGGIVGSNEPQAEVK